MPDDIGSTFAVQAVECARLAVSLDPRLNHLDDPRERVFANAFLDTAAELLRTLPPLTQLSVASGRDTSGNNSPSFTDCLLEVMQNADDTGAGEIRFLMRDGEAGRRELCIVHNGRAVTMQSVLPMIWPGYSTKRADPGARGRLGVGLKALARIASAVHVHGAPYHFNADAEAFARVAPEPAIANWYDPAVDTLLVLHLCDEVDESALVAWLKDWRADRLLFLSNLFRLRWSDAADGGNHAFTRSTWQPCVFVGTPAGWVVEEATAHTEDGAAFMLWRTSVPAPSQVTPNMKAVGSTIDITLALPTSPASGAVQDRPSATVSIGFRTAIESSVPFSIDAPFDPVSARTGILDNRWNRWMIETIGTVGAVLVRGLLDTRPEWAWPLIVLPEECVRAHGHDWIELAFGAALETIRDAAVAARVRLPAGALVEPSAAKDATVGWHDLCYEAIEWEALLSPADLMLLYPEFVPLGAELRGSSARWRAVVESLDLGLQVDAADMRRGFAKRLFDSKPSRWWVRAGSALVAAYAGKVVGPDPLLKLPFLLTDAATPTAAVARGETACPLLLQASTSSFAKRWQLFTRLHADYSTESAQPLHQWLQRAAAFSESIDVAAELRAFAERYRDAPAALDDAELRQLRDLFDTLPTDVAEPLGLKVGQAVAVDCVHYASGKTVRCRRAAAQVYLGRTLNPEGFWPLAAGKIAEIYWVAPRYDDALKITARLVRSAGDPRVQRGARRFLQLLGAAVAPRPVDIGVVWCDGTSMERRGELDRLGAHLVENDIDCPDLLAVARAIAKLPKKDLREARARSVALLNCLRQHWDGVFADASEVMCYFNRAGKNYPRQNVTAAWVLALREVAWIVTQDGARVVPGGAPIKSGATVGLFDAGDFIASIGPGDVGTNVARCLKLVLSVQTSDLVRRLEHLREDGGASGSAILEIYRQVAQQCPGTRSTSPKTPALHERVGDMTVGALRQAFGRAPGLIFNGAWHTPNQVHSGPNIFRDAARFVPPAADADALWRTLGIGAPTLDQCTNFCRDLSRLPLDSAATSALLDLYRAMAAYKEPDDANLRRRLRRLPLVCGGRWVSRQDMPAYFVENVALRRELGAQLSQLPFWDPPLPPAQVARLLEWLRIVPLSPRLEVVGTLGMARLRGEDWQARFGAAVTLLSDSLAREMPAVRDALPMAWPELASFTVYLHDRAVPLMVADAALPGQVRVQLPAHLDVEHVQLHATEDALGRADGVGEAIAQLFEPSMRRLVMLEWAAAWQASESGVVEGLRTASDVEREAVARMTREKLAGTAAAKGAPEVTPPASRHKRESLRELKARVGPIARVFVEGSVGGPANPAGAAGGNPGGNGARSARSPRAGTPLHDAPPAPRAGASAEPRAGANYSNRDLEDRAWQIVAHVLQNDEDPLVVDWRSRHGIGADGVSADWRTFVELKASGVDMPTEVNFQDSQFQRCHERGNDYILALVWGMEEGHLERVKLIFNPLRCCTMRSVSGIKLSGLREAFGVGIEFGASDTEGRKSEAA